MVSRLLWVTLLLSASLTSGSVARASEEIRRDDGALPCNALCRAWMGEGSNAAEPSKPTPDAVPPPALPLPATRLADRPVVHATAQPRRVVARSVPVPPRRPVPAWPSTALMAVQPPARSAMPPVPPVMIAAQVGVPVEPSRPPADAPRQTEPVEARQPTAAAPVPPAVSPPAQETTAQADPAEATPAPVTAASEPPTPTPAATPVDAAPVAAAPIPETTSVTTTSAAMAPVAAAPVVDTAMMAPVPPKSPAPVDGGRHGTPWSVRLGMYAVILAMVAWALRSPGRIMTEADGTAQSRPRPPARVGGAGLRRTAAETA